MSFTNLKQHATCGADTGRADIMHLDRSVVAKQVIAVYEQVISKK